MEALLVLVAALAGSIGGPLLLSRSNSRQRAKELVIAAQLRREEKQADWDRQDAVADRVEEVQKALKGSDEKVNSKLDTIHTLVNSQMTAAIEAELGATERELVLMKHVIDLHKAAGRETAPESVAAVQATQAKVDELRATLADRLRSDIVARAQLEHDNPDPEPTT